MDIVGLLRLSALISVERAEFRTLLSVKEMGTVLFGPDIGDDREAQQNPCPKCPVASGDKTRWLTARSRPLLMPKSFRHA